MKIQQVSVFLENKPGHLSAICRTLSDAGINIVTLSLADTQQFGILRLIVQEWEQARDLLETKGFVVDVREVVATEVEDRPGGVAEILAILEKAEVNIEYMYAFTFRRGDKAILIFRFANPDQAIQCLQDAGINLLSRVELFGAAR